MKKMNTLSCTASLPNNISSLCETEVTTTVNTVSCNAMSNKQQDNFKLRYAETYNGSVGLRCARNSGGKRMRRPSKILMVVTVLCILIGLTIAQGDELCKSLLENQSEQCGVEFFSDSVCTNKITSFSASINGDGPENCGACYPFRDIPQSDVLRGNVFVKASPEQFKTGNRVTFQLGSTCPGTGPAGLILSMRDNMVCYQLGGLTGDESLGCYPKGYNSNLRNITDDSDDSAGTERNGKRLLAKRGGCKSFRVDSQQDSVSASSRVSHDSNCRGQPAPCPITITETDSKSVETTFSFGADIGLDIAGVTRTLSAQFGQSYTVSESTSLANGFFVPPNQVGYLSTYSRTTLFTGAATECDGEDIPGDVNAVIANTQTYIVTITG